jgi:hypothetical protein
MDVTGILSELRSEREDIERAILSLERFDRHGTGTTEAAAQSVTEIRRVREPDDTSPS